MICSLIVFVKNPIQGNVKTRLAATVGHEKAVEVYIELLKHTKKVIKKLLESAPAAVQFRVNIYYGDYINSDDLWSELPVNKYLQTEGDLGQRMKNAFKAEFDAGAKQVVIIGSDCLMLRSRHIKNAMDELSTAEVVIGPATDGGYYLLGMKQLHPFLFEHKSWSQSTLLEETLTDLRQNKSGEGRPIAYELLETLSDIDTWEDYLVAFEANKTLY
ncbi:MAG: TIGR04282 family arsenosugar biosynthesis glycosyltransferase [Spirosomataceae bacterium]